PSSLPPSVKLLVSSLPGSCENVRPSPPFEPVFSLHTSAHFPLLPSFPSRFLIPSPLFLLSSPPHPSSLCLSLSCHSWCLGSGLPIARRQTHGDPTLFSP